MKRSEAYIQKLSEQYHISPATAKVIYEALDTYHKSTVVCTPEEKAAAEKKLASFKNCYSSHFQSKVINEIQSRMLIDSDYVEHNMNEELEDK